MGFYSLWTSFSVVAREDERTETCTPGAHGNAVATKKKKKKKKKKNGAVVTKIYEWT